MCADISYLYIYLGNPDPFEYWTIKHAEHHLGLIELYHFQLTHYLDDKGQVEDARACGYHTSGPYHSAALTEGNPAAGGSGNSKCVNWA
jgi:hypothetical protein